jgi:hypothetical protein
MIYRTTPILLIVFAFGCNTFADPDQPVETDASGNAGLSDSGDSDATTTDMSQDMGVDMGARDPQFEILDLETSPFSEPHEIQTAVALLSGGEGTGNLVSLAYRNDPNSSGDDGFIISTSVADPDFLPPLHVDTISGNNSFQSVSLVRYPTRADELFFSANYDNTCSATLAVDNSLHRGGIPGATVAISTTRNCSTADAVISVNGDVEQFQAVDDSVRYALITTENGARSLSTSSPANTIINYVEVGLEGGSPREDRIYAAPGLVGTYSFVDSRLDLWSGLEGEDPPGTTDLADPATQDSVELAGDFEHLALSGAAPTRYEIWGASGSKLEIIPIPCEVETNPLGHLTCSQTPAESTQSINFEGDIVGLDATRSGGLALASVLTNEAGDHARHLVVYDGTYLETFAIGPSLGDLVQFHISIDAFQVTSDRRIVAIATTYLAIAQGSSTATDVTTFVLSPLPAE